MLIPSCIIVMIHSTAA